MKYRFEWDNRKAQSNIAKHGVSFQQAASVFLDPRMLVLFDLKHSNNEDRWITVGLDSRGALLTVCHTFLQESEQAAMIRIFSARKSTTNEIRQYQEL